jgi:hypothetical protein
MRRQTIRCCLVTLALLAPAPLVSAQDGLAPAVAGASSIIVLAQMASPQAVTDYQRRLAEYEAAREAYEAEASAYWNAIAEKRRGRNAKRRQHQVITLDDYVLTQPPVYAGPRRPAIPLGEPEAETAPSRPRKVIPVVADLLKAASDYYQWMPQRPATEADFKRAYARFAMSAGLTREQAVRVYAFETGGNGSHDMQAGLSSWRPGARAISTAIGYNQLLTTNSVELIAEQGPLFVKVLTQRAAALSGPARQAMETKITVLKQMVALARSVPDEWGEHEKIGDTPHGWAMHAMVLDVDVGPMLQTHKLMTSVRFARAKGYDRPLTAAELEMMNLTGDGTGLDMVTMPQVMRDQVPSANFFQRSGYERNPVASRNNTVAKLLAVTETRMDSNSNQPGARELAAAF